MTTSHHLPGLHGSRRRIAAGVVALGTATTALSGVPAHAATGNHLMGRAGNCSAAVLNTGSGSWLASARHCGTPTTVAVGASTFRVRRVVKKPGSQVPNDLELIQVYGNVKRAAGGGYALGLAPADGSTISVYGIAGRHVYGCSGLRVTYNQGYPQVNHCYLPSGTSGGPWASSGRILRGVVGGLYAGGADNWTTNTIPFTRSVLSWAYQYLY